MELVYEVGGFGYKLPGGMPIFRILIPKHIGWAQSVFFRLDFANIY